MDLLVLTLVLPRLDLVSPGLTLRFPMLSSLCKEVIRNVALWGPIQKRNPNLCPDLFARSFCPTFVGQLFCAVFFGGVVSP